MRLRAETLENSRMIKKKSKTRHMMRIQERAEGQNRRPAPEVICTIPSNNQRRRMCEQPSVWLLPRQPAHPTSELPRA